MSDVPWFSMPKLVARSRSEEKQQCEQGAPLDHCEIIHPSKKCRGSPEQSPKNTDQKSDPFWTKPGNAPQNAIANKSGYFSSRN